MNRAIRFGIASAAGALLAAPVLGGDDFVVGDRMIELDTVVEASASEVWNAWTTSEGLDSFFSKKSTVELRPGGAYELLFLLDGPEGYQGSEGCKVLSYVPGRMLSFTWNSPPQFESVRDGGINTIVVIDIQPMGADMSRVVLRHHGWPDQATTTEQWDKVYEYFENAWPRVLESLANRFDDDATASVDPTNAWVYLFVSFSRPDLLETITEEESQVLQNHYLHLKALTEQGKIVLAGPCTDMKGPGIVIFHANDEEEARRMMASDPAVAEGLFIAELHPMRLSLLRERDS